MLDFRLRAKKDPVTRVCQAYDSEVFQDGQEHACAIQ